MASTTAPTITPGTSKPALRFRFCPETNNILLPREDRANKKLLWCSSLVDYSEKAGETAEDNCVYRNVLTHDASEKTVIFDDVRADPTLPRTKDQLCPKCANREAVFFSSHTPEGMTLWYAPLLLCSCSFAPFWFPFRAVQKPLLRNRKY